MFNQSNLAVVEQQEQALVFQFPDVSLSADFSQEELQDDTDGIRLTFPRAKIPGGGSTLFELPSEDASKPEYVESLQGVILFHHLVNGYWVGEPSDEDKSPLCTSMDGKMGHGDPGGLCAKCQLNTFGSAEDGRGKACKNQRYLYLLRDGEFMPLELHLPPTSLQPFNRFMNAAFLYRNRASYGSVVELSLHREDKPSPHAVEHFRKLYDFTGADLAKAKAFSNAFRTQAKAMLEERVQAIVSQQDDGVDYDGFEKKPSGDGSFVVKTGTAVDGERDELPL